MKKSKIFFTVFALLFALLLAFSAAACGGTDNSGGDSTDPTEEGDPYVTELTITSPPTKTSYRPGERFDSKGMELVAKWSHGVDEELSPTECVVTPKGVLDSGDAFVTFTYEGKSVQQPVDMENVTITSVAFDRAKLNSRLVPGVVDFTQLITAVVQYSDGDRLESTDYSLSIDGQPLRNVTGYALTAGKHRAEATFGSHSDTFDLTVVDGYEIVPKTIIEKDKYEANVNKYLGTNFIELEKTGSDVRNPGIGTESGIACIKQTIKGQILRFHIPSKETRHVELTLSAASGRILENNGAPDNGWIPTRMGDMLLNKTFEVYRVAVDPATNRPQMSGGNEVKTRIEFEDYAAFEGSTSEEPDMKLWANFTEVSFGEMDLQAGDNIFEVRIISDYATKFGSLCAPNIGKFKVLYLPDCEEHDLTHVEEVPAETCGLKITHEYWQCGTCMRTFSDANGTKRLNNVKKTVVEHTPGEEATCQEPQRCTKCGIALTGLGAHKFNSTSCETDSVCEVCGMTVKAGHVLRVDGIVKSCERCGVVGYQFDMGDSEHLSFHKADGTAWTPGISRKNTDPNNLNGSTVDTIGGLDNSNWRDATIRLSFDAEKAGTYHLRLRCQSTGSEGKGSQNMAEIFEYCVNPADMDDASSWTYQDCAGSAAPATVTQGWKDFRHFSLVRLATVQIKQGHNDIVLRKKASSLHGPNLYYIALEREDYLYGLGADAEVTSTRTGGLTWAKGYQDGMAGNGTKLYVNNTYIRLKVPEEQVDTVGTEFYEYGISYDMLPNGTFDTSTVGTFTIPLSVEMFGKTYTANFTYTIREA